MSPRILIVAPNLLYGDPNPRSIRARRLAAGLTGAGFEVEVLTWWSGRETQQERPGALGGARLRAVAAASPFESWMPGRVESKGEPETEGEALAPWTEAALRELRAIPAGARPDLVYAIGVPVAALVAGERLASELGVPLIADLGDPWLAATDAGRAERRGALGAAAALITTTEALADLLRPDLGAGTPIELIPNGGELRHRPPGAGPEPPLFVHLGAINAGRVDPVPAFSALAELHRRGRIEFRSHSTGFHPGFDSLPHPHLPMLDHEAALELTASAGAALVLGNDDPAQLPSKAFEIACTETWALCVCELDDDPATHLLEASGHGVAAINDPAAISAAAETILEREARGERPEPAAAYSWDARVDQLATAIAGLSG